MASKLSDFFGTLPMKYPTVKYSGTWRAELDTAGCWLANRESPSTRCWCWSCLCRTVCLVDGEATTCPSCWQWILFCHVHELFHNCHTWLTGGRERNKPTKRRAASEQTNWSWGHCAQCTWEDRQVDTMCSSLRDERGWIAERWESLEGAAETIQTYTVCLSTRRRGVSVSR